MYSVVINHPARDLEPSVVAVQRVMTEKSNRSPKYRDGEHIRSTFEPQFVSLARNGSIIHDARVTTALRNTESTAGEAVLVLPPHIGQDLARELEQVIETNDAVFHALIAEFDGVAMRRASLGMERDVPTTTFLRELATKLKRPWKIQVRTFGTAAEAALHASRLGPPMDPPYAAPTLDVMLVGFDQVGQLDAVLALCEELGCTVVGQDTFVTATRRSVQSVVVARSDGEAIVVRDFEDKIRGAFSTKSGNSTLQMIDVQPSTLTKQEIYARGRSSDSVSVQVAAPGNVGDQRSLVRSIADYGGTIRRARVQPFIGRDGSCTDQILITYDQAAIPPAHAEELRRLLEKRDGRFLRTPSVRVAHERRSGTSDRRASRRPDRRKSDRTETRE